jgi:hypothetical protein
VLKRLGLARRQLYDVSDVQPSSIIKKVVPADEFEEMCVNVIGTAVDDNPLGADGCSDSVRTMDWPSLRQGRSYIVAFYGKEYRTRQFFDDLSVASLVVTSTFVPEDEKNETDPGSRADIKGGEDEFLLRMGDQVGIEKARIIGIKNECVELVSAVDPRHQREICMRPPDTK